MEIEMDEEEQICQKSFDTKVAERQKEKNMCPLGCDFQNAVGRTQLEPRRPTSCTGRESLHCTDRFNGEQTAADCTGPCAFIPAPANTRDLADTHSPILYLPGWERELRSTGDTVGATFAKGTIGKCVAEGNGIKPINSKRCPGSICRASNGLAVSVQEGCAQACLDDPSGTCVGYSHSERKCILYSPYADKHLVHENGDTWVSDAQPTEPCISYDIPRGCTALNAADPNPAYVCVILKTNPERWEAWTHQIASDKREDVGLRITTMGVETHKYTAEVQNALRLRIAALAFVTWRVPMSDDIGSVITSDDICNVALTVSQDQRSLFGKGSLEKSLVHLDFVIAANASSASAMKKLISAELTTCRMCHQLRPLLPEGALIEAVSPPGAGIWPGTFSTLAIVGIVVGVAVAACCGALCTCKFCRRRAKAEAQQMHFQAHEIEVISNDDAYKMDGMSPSQAAWTETSGNTGEPSGSPADSGMQPSPGAVGRRAGGGFHRRGDSVSTASTLPGMQGL
jgi:hypothetical protein